MYMAVPTKECARARLQDAGAAEPPPEPLEQSPPVDVQTPEKYHVGYNNQLAARRVHQDMNRYDSQYPVHC